MANPGWQTDVYLVDARMNWTEPDEWPEDEAGWFRCHYRGLKGD